MKDTDQTVSTANATPWHIESIIDGCYFYKPGDAPPVPQSVDTTEHSATPDLSKLTICILTLKNGDTVTGVHSFSNAEEFDAAVGRSFARDNAVNKISALEGLSLE
ncbi:Gp49 family protein [Lelliottia amnigena]|uniref:Gp49 family protein n=1 Tax=Lelliottia amnigena TaxID=61646 RepID=UPI001EF98BED|nr:Gp49 family protein [Lelliottia amnigena]MCG7781019.1 hypothetical protein [Lelliottia amnigena]